MKFFITYFYNIRFLPKNSVPLSTAVWDPKWFHANMGQDYVFPDKRGVYNGLRIPELSPEKVEAHDCSKTCIQNPGECTFIKAYHNYIYSLDFNKVKNTLIEFSKGLKESRNLRSLPDVYLLVHEKPDNPCSERGTLIQWFKDNNVELKEFIP